jgi:hypothetical protein
VLIITSKVVTHTKEDEGKTININGLIPSPGEAVCAYEKDYSTIRTV